MRRRIVATFGATFSLVLLLGVASKAGAADLAQADLAQTERPGWKLVWSDEFDVDGRPNPERWTYEVGFVRNFESQYYTNDRPENARVEGGVLVIEGRKERWKNAKYDASADESRSNWHKREFAEYTAASLVTLGKASWTYGRIEVRAKLPSGKGVWPAIWTLGENRSQVGWPKCGELDIMEFVGFAPQTVHANIHCSKYNHAQGTGKGAKLKLDNPSENYHVYAMDWSEERIDFFVDDQKYFTFENDGTGEDAWPYDKPQYLLLNLAIGGTWGAREGIDESIFPQKYLVDYVRVYQRDE